MKLRTRLFSLFIVFAIFQACKNESVTAPNPELIGKVFRSFTKGIISSKSLLKYVFLEDMVSEEMVGKPLAKSPVSLSPASPGISYWETPNTLVFKPNQNLKSGSQYTATVNLESIQPSLSKELPKLVYTFQTREISFTVSKPSFILKADRNFQLIGEVQTSDVSDPLLIEKILNAQQDQNKLDISWVHHPESNSSNYTINNITRAKSSQISIHWDGTPLNLNSKGDYLIPAIDPDVFKLLDVTFEADPQARWVSSFSDNLLSNQNLDGLITVKGKAITLRHVIEGNNVYSYITGQIDGDITLTYSPGITSSNNKKLTESTSWEVNVPGSNPQVRFVGKGTIIPQANDIILPFEAKGLKAIDVEVFKIFDNNILQFLQSNQLDESNDLYRVGRLVSQSKIELNTISSTIGTNTWNHFAIDLNTLLKTDANAIYQVRIGFKPSYTSLTCLSKYKESPLESDELTSFYEDNYYGSEGYYEDYKWEDRDDPCKPAYYNRDQFIAKNVLISNLGIIGKVSDKQLFVAVTDLRTTEPIAGCSIDVYDFQLQKIATLTTDAEGIVQQMISGIPYALIANYQGSKGYLRMAEGQNLSMSAFDIDGQQVNKGLKGLIYGERGVWRPGDSIYLNFILNDKELKLPANHPVKLNVYDAQNKLVIQKITSQSIGHIYSFNFKTSADAPTGNWRASIKAGGADFTKTLKIEAIKPNRLKIKWDAGEEITAAQNSINLNATWLTGLQASGLSAKINSKWSPSATGFPAYKDYEFQDPARMNNDQTNLTLFEGPLDASGNANVPLKISKDFKPSGKMNLRFNIEVSEPGGDFSSQVQSSVYHPYKNYAGVKLPADPWGYKTLNLNNSSTISFVDIDTKGKFQANRKLSVGLYELEWRWWWEQRDNAVAGFNSSNHTKAIQKANITTNSNGLAEWKVSINHWGRYLIRVCDTESGHCSGDFAYAGWPDEGNDQNHFDMATLLRLGTNKEKYQSSETIELNVPAPVLSKMLVTLENGSKVLEAHWVTVDKSPFIFKFQASAAMAPAVYAHVTLIQPHGYSNNDLPMRMYGVIPIPIENGTAKLNPKITSNDSFKPEHSETIEISESGGNPMAYTLDIIDEGLLDITNYKTPDPYAAFYSKEALGVRTWDVYDHVLGAYGGKLESILSIGGDEGLNGNAKSNAVSRFKSPVIHLGPFQLNKNEKKKHSITIRNYVGSVKIMVVAAGDDAYGNAEKAVPVKSPIMILPTLPRILSTNETIKLPVNIFVTDPALTQGTVTIKDKNNQLKFDSNSKNTTFNGAGEYMEYFDFTTSDLPNTTTIQLEAKSGNQTTSQTIEIETRNPNPFLTETTTTIIEPGSSKSIPFKSPEGVSRSTTMVEVSNFQPIKLNSYLDELIQYPYGCAEQTVSAAFPQLYLDQFTTMNANQIQQTKINIEKCISLLSKFNKSDGSFSLWPGTSSETDLWVTSYIGHFMLEAQKKGYLVQDYLISGWKTFQKRMANLYDPAQKSLYKPNHGLDQAYRLYTLALAGSPDLGAMNRLKEYPEIGINARWRLAAAFALAGQKEVAKTMMVAVPDKTDYVESGYTYGSPLRDQAMIMETYLEAGEKDKAAGIALEISKQLNSDREYNTQALAYALQVLGKFLGNSDAKEVAWSFKYQTNGESKQSVNAITASFLIDPKISNATGKSISIENTSSKIIYVVTSVKGQPAKDIQEDASSNLKLSVLYLDDNHQSLSPASLNKGDHITIEVTVQNTGVKSYNNLALTQILPSGWEIINERITDDVAGADHTSNFKYQDIRDDRVFTYFGLNQRQSKTISLHARASYQGTYHLPAITCEDMYDVLSYARIKGSETVVN
ncbi:MAG: MG2 domain-containing protein [Saprospiraceae bacterium]